MDFPHPVTEIQAFHGVSQSKGILLVKGHGRKHRLGQKSEHHILECKGRLGNPVWRANQHQTFDLFRVFQRIVQSQDTPQGKAAQMNRSANLVAVFRKGSAEIGITGLLPFQKTRQFRTQDVLFVIQVRNRIFPAVRFMAGAVNQYLLPHRHSPSVWTARPNPHCSFLHRTIQQDRSPDVLHIVSSLPRQKP